ncbi:hypothetical protein [Acidomonas methanolica]|uniref:hypothetical protein n=1 Tax=Acidomonas methanolica TaxID=437 RepID=UPI002119DF56|nr:hypothetical protein [Acidomonas methanolica]MCQ9155927.1 hypothetical protein [Acidomonas methanolica]
MDHIFTFLSGILIMLFGIIVAVIAVIEHGARVLLFDIGIRGQVATALLALLLLGLIVLAFRWFGRVFGVLIGLLLLMVLLHALFAPVSATAPLSF